MAITAKHAAFATSPPVWHRYLVGAGSMILLDDGNSQRVVNAGENVVVAPMQLHGALNPNQQDCVLLSIVPAGAGFQAA
ncbi:hypothetical protein QDY71_08705 [Kingella negevensis]|uniref:hypothetical protein n=1 Tax=Kingella negevensis TaxID=1522312 RepID=UPI00117AD997|nr:hypothetical protein [Kingella negevensis]MDK4680566.1 hypothetical protein [Kingella negevensis]MDK4681711.1 hypothetical protein [Kingella negevensis]MDK4685168.1 hypothetical protein [Kingella negevensis]MDK4689909.1 hypothetical protein [Kingella negevensis]MDK4692747.1 hypothetical protein [Kingella negevensis]